MLLFSMVIAGAFVGHADDCIGASDPILCLKYQSNPYPHCSPAGTKVWELRFVCKTGTPNAGAGWDIFCRSTDGKCNLDQDQVCPDSGQLTQWHPTDHCTQSSGGGNWTPSKGTKGTTDQKYHYPTESKSQK
jgi:hypothetical protein